MHGLVCTIGPNFSDGFHQSIFMPRINMSSMNRPCFPPLQASWNHQILDRQRLLCLIKGLMLILRTMKMKWKMHWNLDRHLSVLIGGHLSPEAPPPNSLVLDILFRPAELAHVCMWDMCQDYEKIVRYKGKKRARVEDEVDSEEQQDGLDVETGM
ncbi:hypothetical protein HMN09_01387900 [Mycena chlorophos]|uniref:Uncharacterized protein n=1 Tax=Mycena chlorophos TaxID=658473 RepID=A0A8H6VSN0_MYCCL|nr:hypothetical protein HMN09_01387900 [Mycena chlorophos]